MPQADRPALARFAMLAVAASHVTMASVMAMTPAVHLSHIVARDAVTLAVGVTIALHVFGMYGLSPVFGILATDRGADPRHRARAGAARGFARHRVGFRWLQAGVLVALVLLGLGWSAGATVAGSALCSPRRRRWRCGRVVRDAATR